MDWKCGVCGYLHQETDPPEICPVCEAEKSRFGSADIDSLPAEDADTESTQKRWKCLVCGYIHTGEKPPEKCPVCGADRSRFVEVDADGNPFDEASGPPTTSSATSVTETESEEGAVDRRWKCTVCGYMHTGPEPPEKCPACGADRSLFVEVALEASRAPEPPEEKAAPIEPLTRTQRYYLIISELMVKQHAHPISVHLPNGVAPIGVLFLFVSVLFQSPSFEIAGNYNLLAVLLAMPFVLFSGINDWKKRFGGNLTTIFLTKMICGGIISGLLVILLLWRALDPSVLRSPGGMRALYLLLNGVLVAAAALAGYMGGKLVFPNR